MRIYVIKLPKWLGKIVGKVYKGSNQ
ncbi:MAG: stage V sporulation protein M [Zhenhengia sp.]|uniref:Stage V sporulation protein M n=1 Tax=Zhenhengia yiwuensis TaxID=2763666 RepID=A0A926EE75_9FIRM|nr:stage V sporulation protein M [Zhenhengia yiwuensis]MBP3911118.1 stage V sporulation protein M [Niameybacter sp.]MBS5315788.1 stage V sporulation protein M [Clostridiales bacterium]MBS5798316.1 stage V sporulation protein M [Clostridiales bacterium]